MTLYASGLVTKLSMHAALEAEYPFLMPSFWYKTRIKELPESGDVIVDSGAHSIQEHGQIHEETLITYFDKYVTFVSNWPRRAVFVEMDVEFARVPLRRVDAMYEALRATGRPIMRVWHIERGERAWIEYCESGKHPILGVSLLDTIPKPYLLRLITVARANGVVVHGFGCSSATIWRDLPLWSMDASSWASGLLAFGSVMTFDEGTGKGERFKYRSDDPATAKRILNSNLMAQSAKLVTEGRIRLRDPEGRAWTEFALADQLGQMRKMAAFFHRYWAGLGWDLWAEYGTDPVALYEKRGLCKATT